VKELEARRVDELVSFATRSAIHHSFDLLPTPFPDTFKLVALTFGVDGIVRQPACDVL